MRWNWRPSRVAFWDVETWSPVPLESHRRYVGQCTVLCHALRVDGVTEVNPTRERLAQVAAERTMVAHNAPFDAAVWGHLGLPDAEWCDTLPMARAAGLPGGLDRLGERLTGRGKDEQGKRVLQLFVKSKVLPPRHLPIYDVLEAYCARDVELLEAVFGAVQGCGEPDVMAVDRAVNDRGVPVDGAYLSALGGVMRQNSEEAEARVSGHFNPRSPKQVVAWLNAHGYGVTSAAAEVVRDLELDDEDAEVMADRREVVRVGLGKVKAGLTGLDDDGRLRGQFAYMASPVGRWASYGLQLHNMPKSEGLDVRSVEPDVASVRAAAGRLGCSVSDVTTGMLRHSVRRPGMMVADFSAVEPRVLSWLARDEGMLAVWRDPARSAYLEMGRRVFGREITKAGAPHEYFIAKQLVIGCGYGMSGWKFGLHMAKFGRECPQPPEQLVRAYRRALPAVVALWADYGDAVMRCAREGACAEAGRCTFHREGGHMVMWLPSGRPVWYRDVRVEQRVPVYKHIHHMPLTPEDTVVYTHPVFGPRELYGGKVAENADQGTARDLLAHVLVQLEASGHEPFMHAHDEAAGQRGRFYEFMRTCSTPPAWADGLPLAAEGYVGPMWAKDASGWESARYQNGVRT